MFLIYMSHKIGWANGQLNDTSVSSPSTFYLILDTHGGYNKTTGVSGEMSISWAVVNLYAGGQ